MLSKIQAFPAAQSECDVYYHFKGIDIHACPVIIAYTSHRLPFIRLMGFVDGTDSLTDVRTIHTEQIRYLRLGHPYGYGRHENCSRITNGYYSSVHNLLCLPLRKISFHISHITQDGGIQYFGIVLGHTDIGVPQNFCHILHAHLIRQKYHGSRSMAGDVGRQPFLYSANIGYFLQVSIHLLVAQHRQEYIFCYAIRLVGILVYQFAGRGYDGDVTHLFCLLAGFPNPQIALVIPYKMLLAKLLDIRKSHAGEAAESKDIPYLLQPFNIEILIHQPVELFFGKKFQYLQGFWALAVFC